MHSAYTKVLSAGLLVLLVSPAFAQPPGGRGAGMRQPPTAASLLRDDKVQEELKFTDDQKAQLTKITDKYKDDLATARTNKDRAKRTELTKAMNADIEKALPDLLKAEQSKRLNQLVLQASGVDAFTKDEVKTALKLTDKQTKDITDEKAEFDKDAQDLLKDAQGDKRREAFTKVMTMRKELMDKVTASLMDDQKKSWQDLTGDKFEFSFGQRRPRTNSNQ